MEQDIDKIKSDIEKLAIKYDLRYIVFKTTEVGRAEGKVIGANVEAEMIY